LIFINKFNGPKANLGIKQIGFKWSKGDYTWKATKETATRD